FPSEAGLLLESAEGPSAGGEVDPAVQPVRLLDRSDRLPQPFRHLTELGLQDSHHGLRLGLAFALGAGLGAGLGGPLIDDLGFGHIPPSQRFSPRLPTARLLREQQGPAAVAAGPLHSPASWRN